MKRTARILSALLTVSLFLAGHTLAQAPLPISPGAEDGAAVVISGCPTFSWSEVEGATSYRVTAFTQDDLAEPLSYDEMVSFTPPVFENIIPDRGLSWTPSADRCLSGGSYVWFVAAVSMEGVAEWSGGKLFKVDALTGLDAVSGEEPDEDSARESGDPASASGAETGALSLEQVLASKVTREQLPTSGEISSQVAVPMGEEGVSNTFYGDQAGSSIVGDQNATFIGAKAGQSNTNGSKNTFVGYSAGTDTTTGDRNTFVGYLAGYKNTTGHTNSFFGQETGRENLTGSNNTFIGVYAGFNNTAGHTNTFIGLSSGYSNTSAEGNTCIGTRACNKNTTGGINTCVGYQAGYNNTSGFQNTFIGYNAGYSNTTSNDNAFLGRDAGYLHSTGSENTFLGARSGHSNIIGRRNVFIGYRAGYHEEGSNKLYIDMSDTATPLIYGEFDNDIVKIHGQLQMVSAAASSDIRLKREIQPLDSSLDKVLALQGVSYQWKTDQYPDWGFRDTKQIGLVAQDVEAVLPELVSTDSKGYKAVSYDKLTAVLVEAVKELKNDNERLKADNEEFKAQIEELRDMIKELRG